MPVSLFLHWYEIARNAYGENDEFSIKGWDALESTDALMVTAALAAVALVIAAPRYAGRALLLIGAATAGFIAVQLIDGPAVIGFIGRSKVSLELGAWLGLMGAVLLVAAGAIDVRAQSTATGR